MFNFLVKSFRTAFNEMCTMYSMYNVQCTVYNVLCAMYCVQCTGFNVLCAMCSIQFTVHNVQCTMYSIRCIHECTVYKVLCTLHLLSEVSSPSSINSSYVIFMLMIPCSSHRVSIIFCWSNQLKSSGATRKL